MAEGLVARDWNVAISTLEASASHPSVAEIENAQLSTRVFKLRAKDAPISDRGENLLQRDLTSFRLLRALYRIARVDDPCVVVVPYLDYCLHSIALKGSPFEDTPWVGITLRPSFHYEEMGIIAPAPRLKWLRKSAFKRLLQSDTLRRCLTIDAPLKEYCDLNFPNDSRKIAFMPDPVSPIQITDDRKARMEFGIPEGKPTILVFGKIGDRKGLSTLFEAVAAAPSLQHVQLLLVGEQDDSMRARLQSPPSTLLQQQQRLFIHNHWASASTESNAFSACDIVWLGYNNHWQSSGVLIQAGMAGKPVAATREGIIGWHTSRHQCGITFNTNDSRAVIDTLERLISSPLLRDELGANGRRAALPHTIDRATAILDAALRDR